MEGSQGTPCPSSVEITPTCRSTAPAGQVLADFVTETRASVILSLRHLSMNDQRKFAGDFAKRLYERKGQVVRYLCVDLVAASEEWAATRSRLFAFVGR
jgi:hypothetical protein